jgi:hypothetical protein
VGGCRMRALCGSVYLSTGLAMLLAGMPKDFRFDTFILFFILNVIPHIIPEHKL